MISIFSRLSLCRAALDIPSVAGLFALHCKSQDFTFTFPTDKQKDWSQPSARPLKGQSLQSRFSSSGPGACEGLFGT